MAYVLGVLALFGLLAGVGFRAVRAGDRLVTADRWESQARLLARSGIDYALSRIGPPGPKQDLAFATDGIDYHFDDPNLSFSLRVRSRGLFARAIATGHAAAGGGTPWKSARMRTSLVGQSVDLGGMPAIGLTNREGNMVLAGSAEVTGPVLLWRGDVRKSTDYHVRWKGGKGHAGPVWDSLSPAWTKVAPDFRRARTWMEAQQALLAEGPTGSDPDYDSGDVRDVRLADSAYLSDTVLMDSRIWAGKSLRVGKGVVLVGCKLMAPRILIEEDAAIERSIVFASRRLDIRGGLIRGGQFAAGDSIHLESGSPLEDWPVFYVQGRTVRRETDSAYIGHLGIIKAGGEGIFLSPAEDRPQHDYEIRLQLGPGARVNGFLYTGGFAHIEGHLRGSLICKNLKFEHKGTIWLGHLKDAHIESLPAGSRIPAPLLFPGFAPMAFGEDMP